MFDFDIQSGQLLNYAVSHAFVGLGLAFLSAFVLAKNPERSLNRIFSFYSISIAWWSFFTVPVIIARDPVIAHHWNRVCLVGAVLIPSAFFHFVATFLNRKKQLTKIIFCSYICSGVFLLADMTPNYLIAGVSPRDVLNFYTVPGPVYHYFVAFFFLVASLGVGLLVQEALRRHADDARTHLQMRWMMLASLCGYLGAVANFLFVYDIKVPFLTPAGNYAVLVYGIVVAYLILRHRFLDIEVIVRRTVVFASVFSFVFAIFASITVLTHEFLSAHMGSGRLISLALTVFLLLLVYDPLRQMAVRITDRFLFQRRYDYHKLLRDASTGISRIESLHHLLSLVVHFVTMRVRVKNAAVLIHEPGKEQFKFVYPRGYAPLSAPRDGYAIDVNHPMIEYMRREKQPLDREKVRDWLDESKDHYDFKAIQIQMDILQAACCVPSFLGEELNNILVLGEKKSGDFYTDDDLNVLFTLAHESAIAIENARLYDQAVERAKQLEEINNRLEFAQSDLIRALNETEVANKKLRDTHVQLIHEQKMATLGRLASSVGHEVNNPLTILSMNVSRAILKYRRNPDLKVSEILDIFQKMEQNISRIKAVVNTLTGLLKKSERGKFEPLSLKLVLEETLPLVRFQTYLENLSGTEVEFRIPGSLPLIKGDLERLQEVFLNLFINAYHAMAGKRLRKILVTAQEHPANPKLVLVEFSDNGCGMSDEVMKKMFSYGFTTKPAGKGSGMGLYMCRYIIELHGGEIKVRSKLGEGTTFVITIPVYREESTAAQAPAQGLPA